MPVELAVPVAALEAAATSAAAVVKEPEVEVVKGRAEEVEVGVQTWYCRND